MPNYIYKHRRGTTAQWGSVDITPLDGEIVVEKCTDGLTRLKIGDGTTPFDELDYMNTPGYASVVYKATISLPAASWVGSSSPYSQVVTLQNVTTNSKIDLQIDPQTLTYLQSEEISLTAVNDSGTVTVYAIGEKPLQNVTAQATISETTTY